MTMDDPLECMYIVFNMFSIFCSVLFCVNWDYSYDMVGFISINSEIISLFESENYFDFYMK